jgi:chromosomal replication initiator protein
MCARQEVLELTMDDREIVSAVYAKLADRVGADRYETWFANGSCLGFADGRLTVSAPNSFIQDWQRKLFRKDLVALCADIAGQPTEVEFVVDTTLATEAARIADSAGTLDPHAASIVIASIAGLKSEPQPASSTKSRLRVPGKQTTGEAVSRATTPKGRPSFTFDQYVMGPCNKFALHSAQLVLEQPGKMSPLTLYGRPGLGKTHLLESLLAAARQKKTHALQLTAEQFASLYIEACQGKGVPSFRQKYRGVELLMIDDIHFFGRTRGTLVELLYTIDTLQKAGKQIVFAADRAPAELTELGPEIVGRLTAGLNCELSLSNFATRRGIVQQLCQRMQLELPAGADGQIALQISGTARELAGALNLLDATRRALGQPLTSALVEETVTGLANQSSRVVQLRDIEEVVCDVFGVSAESLHSNRRGEDVQHPRLLAMFLARKHTRAALGEISRYFGRRSHSTAISANRTVAAWMEEHRTLTLARHTCEIEQTIRKIEEQLLAG